MSHVVIATWKAKPGKVGHIRKILETVAPLNRTEEKMLQFEVLVSVEDPATFVLYEKYTDASGYEEHRETEAFKSYILGEALPDLAERNVTQFDVID